MKTGAVRAKIGRNDAYMPVAVPGACTFAYRMQAPEQGSALSEAPMVGRSILRLQGNRQRAKPFPSLFPSHRPRTAAFSFMAGVMSKKTAPEFESPDDQLEPGSDRGAIMNENRARQAVALGQMRYVLAISLDLVIAGFIVLYVVMRP